MQAEIDAWLRGGGLVIAASDRAARALTSAFHRARRAEGLKAWPAPAIFDWKSFVRGEWERRGGDGRLLLNPAQEQALWAEIAGSYKHLATLLEGPRHRLATLAMEAHELLSAYAPRFLRAHSRAGWQQDAAAFSDWLVAFDNACRNANLLSCARLPLELQLILEGEPAAAGEGSRPQILLAGFDRILPTQRNLLDAWGGWKLAVSGEAATLIRFYETTDTQSELGACALWCRQKLDEDPNARLLVITQGAADRQSRGQIERAFLKHVEGRQAGQISGPLFEFSLGVPLSEVTLPKAALYLLRWLSGSLAEHELDWLFSTGYVAGGPDESQALQAHMRAVRQRGLQQPQWTLHAFLGQAREDQLPQAWIQRMRDAERRLAATARRPQSPMDWVELIPQVLEVAGFPGDRPLSSLEHQAADRWKQGVETCASLGFNGQRMQWKEFLSLLARTLDETLYSPESRDAPIQIAGPQESAGLAADAVWFLGAHEDAWPAGGATHPLIPPEVQRQAGMPHASAQLDWELAHAITTRLMAAAPEVYFSYARQTAAAEARPSRMVCQLAGTPEALPAKLTLAAKEQPLAIEFEDFSRIPFPPGKVVGGASVLTSQSQCAFKAFATARLSAQGWEPAEAGLTPSQRGKLLHSALHSIWGGAPDGISSLGELVQMGDQRRSFVAGQVEQALREGLNSGIRDRMPARYLELEGQRLTGLVTEWLDYESTRVDFEVIGTEVKRTIHLEGLTLDLRLDRIDRLNDDSLLVVDYKSGDVSPKSWDLPRPDDVQLPLYAGFALDGDLGGLAFAKVRAGEQAFEGRVGDAKATLFADLKAGSALVKNRLTAELLIDWRTRIEQLARDFVAGRAEVDPRDYPKTCELCGLQTLCRILENEDPAQLEAEADLESAEDADE
jgi:probable DNA repair protein